MLRARLVMLALAVTAGLGGCGGGSAERSSATASPMAARAYPVAYAVARSDVWDVASKPLPDALERAEVVATSEWEPYSLVVLLEWLHEHGIDLDPPRALDPAVSAMGETWDAPVLVIAAEHQRSYGRRLARIRADEDVLGAYYDEFNEDSWPEAGRAMAHWLGIVQRATELVDERHVVVIPLTE